MQRVIIAVALGLVAAAAASAAATAQTAQSHTDAAGCSESGPLPNQIRCFIDAAQSAGDVGLCDSAYDFAVRFNCISLYAERSADPAPCERIPIRNNRMLLLRDSCIAGVAAATRSPQLCEQVQLAVVRDGCFLTQVVEFDGAAELCARITKTAVKELCFAPPADPK